MGARKKTESKEKSFVVPKEHRAKIAKLSKEEDLIQIRLHINKEAYKAAIKAGDEDAAYAARFVQEGKLQEAAQQAHEDLWKALQEAVPGLDAEANCYNYNTKDHRVEVHQHDDGVPDNLMGMLQRSMSQSRN